MLKDIATQAQNTLKTLGSASREWMTGLLSMLEPVSCAPKALTGMIPKGKKAIPQVDLQRMVTLELGWDNNMEFKDELADEDAVLELARSDSQKRGYRLRNYEAVPNPAFANLDGLYDYCGKTGNCAHNFTGDEYNFTSKVPKEIVAKLTVFLNWSEAGAVLKDPNGKYKFALTSFFPNQFVQEPDSSASSSTKKRCVGKQPVNMQRTVIDERVSVPPPRKKNRAA